MPHLTALDSPDNQQGNVAEGVSGKPDTEGPVRQWEGGEGEVENGRGKKGWRKRRGRQGSRGEGGGGGGCVVLRGRGGGPVTASARLRSLVLAGGHSGIPILGTASEIDHLTPN